MLSIKARLEAAEVQRLLRSLSRERSGQALSVAINQSARQVETQAEALIAKRLGFKGKQKKRVKQGVFIRPFSTPETLTALLVGSGSEIPLKVFGARELRSGVKSKIWGTPTTHRGAFMLGGRRPNRVDIGMGGHVFERTRTSRGGTGAGYIRKLPGASIGEAMARDAVDTAIREHAEERLVANVNRQLDRYLRQQARRNKR